MRRQANSVGSGIMDKPDEDRGPARGGSSTFPFKNSSFITREIRGQDRCMS